MLTTPVPATVPANATTPGPAASTVPPAVPARSTPRCPGSHGRGGGWNGRVTRGCPASGQPNAAGRGRSGGGTGARSAGRLAGEPPDGPPTTTPSTLTITRIPTARPTMRGSVAGPVRPEQARIHRTVDGEGTCGQPPQAPSRTGTRRAWASAAPEDCARLVAGPAPSCGPDHRAVTATTRASSRSRRSTGRGTGSGRTGRPAAVPPIRGSAPRGPTTPAPRPRPHDPGPTTRAPP
jgi:hypothetical protein